MGTIAAVSAAVAIAAHVYTDFLWFKEVGQEQVYWTSLKWNLLEPQEIRIDVSHDRDRCAHRGDRAHREQRSGAGNPPQRDVQRGRARVRDPPKCPRGGHQVSDPSSMTRGADQEGL